MGKPLSYIRLLTSNFEEMFQFYKDVLGLELKFGSATDSYAEFETGTTDIALFQRNLMEEAISQPLNPGNNANIMIVIAVSDVDVKYNDLKSKGIEFVKEPVSRPDWDVRTAQLLDPDNNLIEINTRLEKE